MSSVRFRNLLFFMALATFALVGPGARNLPADVDETGAPDGIKPAPETMDLDSERAKKIAEEIRRFAEESDAEVEENRELGLDDLNDMPARGTDGTVKPAIAPETGDAETTPEPVTPSETTLGDPLTNRLDSYTFVEPTAGPNLGVPDENIKYFNRVFFEQKYETDQSGPSPTAMVEVMYTMDGQTWVIAGQDPLATGMIRFSLPGEGRYGIKLVTTDTAGNIDDSWATTGTRYLFIIDMRPPDVTLDTTPFDGSDLSPEERVQLSWSVKDDHLVEKSTSIEYCTDGGRTWEALYTGLPANGAQNFFVPKRPGYAESYRLLFRVSARDKASNVNQATTAGFQVIPDNIGMPPGDEQAVIQNPEGFTDDPYQGLSYDHVRNRVNQRNFYVDYSVKNVGESGIKYIELWYTKDNGRTWVYFGRDEDKASPFEFHAPEDGLYGFYLIIENNAGTRLGKRPMSGTLPVDSSLTLVDTSAPFVQLVDPRGGQFWKGYDRNYVKFKVFDRNLDHVDFYVSQDSGASWELHTRNLQNNGEFHFATQNYNCRTMRVKIVATDKVGNWTSEESEKDFAIDTKIPEIQLTDVSMQHRPVSGSTPVGVVAAPAATDARDAAGHAAGTNEPGKAGGHMTMDSGNTQMPEYMLEADKAFARGVYHRASKEYDEAMRCFERALQIQDAYDAAYYEIGYLHMLRGDTDLAREFMQRAIRIEEKPVYYAGLGKAYAMEEDWANALIYLHRVTEIAPREAGSLALDAMWFMSTIYAKQKDYISASRLLEEISAVSNPPSHYRDPALRKLVQYKPLIAEQLKKQEEEKKK